MVREPILSTKIRVLTWFFSSLVAIWSCSPQQATESNRRGDSAPVIAAVRISPEKATIESHLTTFVQCQNLNGDSITYHYQWVRNDEEIIGENKNTLKSGNFKRGDLIQVRATPSDGRVDGIPVLSPAVKILNSSPVIQEAWIDPKVAYGTDHLQAHVKSFDPDGDVIYYTYQWERNGVVLSEEKGEILERGRFKKGDSITVIVTPDDRESFGSPKKSESLVISNSPPVILSTPPASVEKMTYLYQVRANDPDNDPITFSLKSGPKEMEMDKTTGLIKWEIRKEAKGNHSVEIEVSDDAGAKGIQRYTLTIDFK